jgi:hypothetical protein
VRGSLVAQTIEADVVIRDPQSSLQQALVGTLVVFVVLVLRVWLGPFGLSRGSVAIMFTVAAGGMGATLFRLPVWVRVGARGVIFRSWFRTGQFKWADIESCEVGNPSAPRFAYIVLRPTVRGKERAVPTPRFMTITPVELVGRLKAKQMVFAAGA